MEHYGLFGIIPPLLAIILALLTKEVIISLTVGILSGTLILAHGNIFTAITIFTDKVAAMTGDSWNVRILLFCALLGAFVSMLSKTGATKAFGLWASKYLKTKKSVLIFTWFFGLIIFIDDYFNSLSVGTVMRPAFDEKKISRAKLAYILDSTAAPVCILAPISTWVVTVMSYIRDSEGFESLNMSEFIFFIKMIPYSVYPLLALAFVVLISLFFKDFGPMKRSEDDAANGKLFNEDLYGACPGNLETISGDSAKWYDMVIAIVVLILVCIVMFPITTYMGLVGSDGIETLSQAFNSTTITNAFIQTDASKALFYGAVISLIIMYIYYVARRLLNVRSAGNAIMEGIKSMVPALVVLALAWTIGNVIKSSPEEGGLGLASFLSEVVKGGGFPLWLLPAIGYLLGCVIAFSTGTSWGTFAILIPIVIPIATGLANANGYSGEQLLNVLLISVGSLVSGAVFGDHCSPISDTTILSSTGSNCPLLEHVSTQLPYASLVAIASFIGVIVGGITLNPFLALLTGFVIMCIMAILAPKFYDRKTIK
ncbi:Na+/H+ antiporter NhaC family protein [Brachyspira pilosicoli]|uniref:Na:H+ antiporter n=2 Tax=Brachyspira pilosicoli TaxID=52584 RepID=D8ID57_BRAP9|nr:Na+/H+ antiporter NhaC family protein [Brachyspira pilosicoli]ADK31080.1 Na:H+ antiporter [Brachyspira pilosicoli 95/1000]MBW5377206.1 Na+/H+ antiporter NhaC family protein [Brachyspira pilosicoli]MBW5391135.1 Na+/H+ antiporter NhaC family protein [Brachyspira pilosicoli]WIH80905.1 Na+/H+ antiporter NhaC family protein [Brachyspira pilosicoli]WIH87603.1 Na+/H+ antiporter NhaC family protein [Brachyspira pilosicoli]